MDNKVDKADRDFAEKVDEKGDKKVDKVDKKVDRRWIKVDKKVDKVERDFALISRGGQRWIEISRKR